MPKKDLVILPAYPNTELSQEVLKECILQLNSTFDIALTTHYAVNTDIQNLVQYYIFDSFNDLIESENNYVIWFKNDLFHLQIKHTQNYAYSAYSCLSNAVKLLYKKYDYFYHINYDVILDSRDIGKLLDLKNITLSNNKKSLFFCEFMDLNSVNVPKLGTVDSKLFFSDVRFFIENFMVIDSKKQFVEYTEKFIEPYVPIFLESFYSERIDNWSNGNVYVLQECMEDFFVHSRINVLNSFNSNPKKNRDYQFYLVKEKTSDRIFFAYINKKNNIQQEPIPVKINDDHFTINSGTYCMYREVFTDTDHIHVKIEDMPSIYSKKNILEQSETYIEFY